MTIPGNIPARISASGNDTTAIYDFPFRIEKLSDLTVSFVEDDTGTMETYIGEETDRFDSIWEQFPLLGGVVRLYPYTPDPGQLEYLDVDGFLKSGFTIIIQYTADARQITAFKNTSNMTPVNVEKALDRMTMALKAAIDLGKQALRIDGGGDVDPVFPPLPGNENRGLYVNSNATGFAFGPTVFEIEGMVDAAAQSASDAAQSATDAANQVTLAAAQVTLAQNAATDAANQVTLATQAATDAETAKDAAEQAVVDAADQVALATTQANNAAASAVQSEISAMRTLFITIVELDVSDSPYTVTESDKNTMFKVDTSGGNVTITLPLMSTVDPDFKIGVVKVDANNQITVSRNIGNTINGGGDVVITDIDFGLVVWPVFPGTDWLARFFILESAAGGGSGGGGFVIDGTTQSISSGGQVNLLGSTPQQEVRVVGNGGPQDADVLPFALPANHGDVITIRGTDSTDYVKFTASDVDYGLLIPADFYATKGASITLIADMVALRYYQIARTDMP